MKIVNSYPPNIDLIRVVLADPADATYVFDGSIYNPSGKDISPDILHHESIHLKQQGGDSAGWWQRYLEDEDFRQEQELAAYGEQYRYAKDNGVVGKLLGWALDNMSLALSSGYRLSLTFGQAKSRIRNYGG